MMHESYYNILLFCCTQLQRKFKAVASLDDVSMVMETWVKWREKILKFAEIESATRPVIKKLPRCLPKCEEVFCPNGMVFKIQIIIIMRLWNSL